MTGRQRILDALACRPLERPPIWIMRQAGRYLPEYRLLKKRHDFVEMVRTPELAMEVSLQPLRRFPLDAAIVFSDILVVNEAMGQPYGFRDEGGICMEFAIEKTLDVERLQVEEAKEKLDYVGKTISLLRNELAGEKALLGFCGSPWTLACYAIDGGSAEGFPRTMRFAKERPEALGLLLEKFTRVIIDYIKLQISSGADAIQIFDTWGRLCPDELFEEWSLRWIRKITHKLGDEVPIILYSQGSTHRLKAMTDTGVDCLGLDHSLELAEAKRGLDLNIAVQGNLDPALLDQRPQAVISAARNLLTRMSPHPGHVFNLGHGIRPTAKIECVEALVETVTKHSNQN